MFKKETMVSNGDDGDGSEGELEPRPDTSQGLLDKVDTLVDQVELLEQQFSDQPFLSRPSVDDPELVAKTVHACMRSDSITEEEELENLKIVISRSNLGN